MNPAQGHVAIREIHWLMDMLQSIDVGLVVLDEQRKIHLWNSFMENHSGITPNSIIGKDLLDIFPDIPKMWFTRKLNTVFLLESRSFTTWEQRPFLFKFKNYHPITGACEYMYQNITFMPLLSADGKVDRVGMIIYDVTDIAINKINLKEANENLQALSRTDGLTQLYNRAYWEECLASEFARSSRTKQPCSLIIFDIDHFKRVNDTYGHQAGDRVIQSTSLSVRKSIRLTDIPGRYGGEEFAVILVDCNAKNAKIFAERLRRDIQNQSVDTEQGKIKWTVSLGIAEYNSELNTYKQWIEQSDQALYQAKENGRNNSVIYAGKLKKTGSTQ